jgi:hypothetical protein
MLPSLVLAASMGAFIVSRPAAISAGPVPASRVIAAEELAPQPRLTAPISTVVARAAVGVRILAIEAALPAADEARVRADGAVPLRVLGVSECSESFGRFVESLRGHAFLGPIAVIAAPQRPGGTFEVRLGDRSEELFAPISAGAAEVLARGEER